MGAEKNGVMHKKWIRNEGKTENGERDGGRDAEKAGGTEETRKCKKKGFDAAKHFLYSRLCK